MGSFCYPMSNKSLRTNVTFNVNKEDFWHLNVLDLSEPESLRNGWLWVFVIFFCSLRLPLQKKKKKKKHTCDIRIHKNKACGQLNHQLAIVLLGRGRDEGAAVHLTSAPSAFPLGRPGKLHFPASLAVRVAMWLSSGQWEVGRIDVPHCQAWCIKP